MSINLSEMTGGGTSLFDQIKKFFSNPNTNVTIGKTGGPTGQAPSSQTQSSPRDNVGGSPKAQQHDSVWDAYSSRHVQSPFGPGPDEMHRPSAAYHRVVGLMEQPNDWYSGVSSSSSSSSRTTSSPSTGTTRSTAPRASSGGAAGGMWHTPMPPLPAPISFSMQAKAPTLERYDRPEWQSGDPANIDRTNFEDAPPGFERDREKYAKLLGEEA